MSGEVVRGDRTFDTFDDDGKSLSIVSLQTSETVTIAFDLSDAINLDDALISVVGTTTTPAIAVTEIGSSDLTIASVTLRKNRVNADITAGIAADGSYLVQCQATTNDGDVISRRGTVHGT